MCLQGSRTVLLGLEVMPQEGYKWRPDSTDTKLFVLIFRVMRMSETTF